MRFLLWHTGLLRPLSVVLAFLVFFPLGWPDLAVAPSLAQDDPSAIVLPGQSGNVTRRDSGRSITRGTGGLFRIFRFEPQRQRQTRLLPTPQVEIDPQLLLPPPKDPDAVTVVTFGDEFADQMREGLVDRFGEDRLIEAVGVSIPGSGLTDLDSFNWNVEAVRRLGDYTQVGTVVVAIGYSDRRAIDESGRRYSFGSSNWRDAYRNRVTSFALTLLAEGYPVIFVGLPPMADPVLDADVRLINEVIEEAVAPTRARFVSVYAGFADVEGNYVRAGPNMSGQVENLRLLDGIFFNRAGRAKFAHFVERFIPRRGGVAPEPEVSTIVFEGSTLSEDGVGPVILMTSGFADPQATLENDVADVLPDEPQARARLLQGATLPPPQGRADSFAWPGEPDS